MNKYKCKALIFILLILLFPPVKVMATENIVKVSIPNFDIRINNCLVDNERSRYPFIYYKNITYIPLLNEYRDLLNFKKIKTLENLNLTQKNDLAKSYQAKIFEKNDKSYPLLSFKGIVYYPLTHENELKRGIEIKTNKDGLNIISQPVINIKGLKCKVDNFNIFTSSEENLPTQVMSNFVTGVPEYENVDCNKFKNPNIITCELKLKFSPCEKRIYFPVSAKWYDPSNTLIYENNLTNQYIDVNWTEFNCVEAIKKEEKWKDGRYRLDIYIDNNLSARKYFEIVETSF